LLNRLICKLLQISDEITSRLQVTVRLRAIATAVLSSPYIKAPPKGSVSHIEFTRRVTTSRR